MRNGLDGGGEGGRGREERKGQGEGEHMYFESTYCLLYVFNMWCVDEPILVCLSSAYELVIREFNNAALQT